MAVVMVWGRVAQTFVDREGVANLVGWPTSLEYTLANGVLRRIVRVRKGGALTEEQARYILGDDLAEEDYRWHTTSTR